MVLSTQHAGLIDSEKLRRSEVIEVASDGRPTTWVPGHFMTRKEKKYKMKIHLYSEACELRSES